MIFGPVTDAEQVLWQARAANLLAAYLDAARRTDLPPIAWTVGTAGSSLIGRCRTSAELEAWQGFLHLPDVRPNVRPGVVHAGYARRRASGTAKTPGGMNVTVTLLADIDPDHERLEHDRREGPPEDAA